jgi:nucleoside-diphosphate-sugar epimerase
VQVFGGDWPTPDGSGVRDYIHVMDLAEGHLAALKASLSGGDQLLQLTFGSGQGHSVLEVIEAFGRACGHAIPYVITQRRSGDAAITVVDPPKPDANCAGKPGATSTTCVKDAWHWRPAPGYLQFLKVGNGLDLTIPKLAGAAATATCCKNGLFCDATKPDGVPQKHIDVSRLSALVWIVHIPLVQGLTCTKAVYREAFFEQIARL